MITFFKSTKFLNEIFMALLESSSVANAENG